MGSFCHPSERRLQLYHVERKCRSSQYRQKVQIWCEYLQFLLYFQKLPRIFFLFWYKLCSFILFRFLLISEKIVSCIQSPKSTLPKNSQNFKKVFQLSFPHYWPNKIVLDGQVAFETSYLGQSQTYEVDITNKKTLSLRAHAQARGDIVKWTAPTLGFKWKRTFYIK